MPGRLLAVAPNWLGDAVMALPAIAAFRRHHPADTLIVAGRAAVAPLFRMVAGVDEVITVPGPRGPLALLGWREEASALAASRADTALLLPNSFRSAWVVRRAGIRERWGFAADLRKGLLTRAVARPRLPNRHHSEYYRALTTALGFEGDGVLPPVVAPAEAVARAEALLDARGIPPGAVLVGMAPGAAYGRAKQWPPRRFAELVRELAARYGATTLLVGSRGDTAAGDEIARACAPGDRGRLVNLIGLTDLALLAAVMRRCRAFVSNDSGAMHLAAAVGIPVAALFGATNERETAPLVADAGAASHAILTAPAWCRPCMLRECPIDHRCMTGIAAASVAEAVGRQIGDPGVRQAKP